MILYIGNFQSEWITKLRGIPSRNAAGSNRIYRIAKSLELNGKSLEIVSPATSLRSKPLNKNACRAQLEVFEGLNVFYSRTHFIPILNVIFSFFSILKRIMFHKRNLKTIIIYNFNLEFIFIALYIRFFSNIKLINNIEDISVSKWSDWTGSKKEVNPLQQLLFSFSMKVISRLSEGFIIPTNKFISYLPVKSKNVCLVTGCFEIKHSPNLNVNLPLRILFSGKITEEFGIILFLNSLQKLSWEELNNFHISICGGTDVEWFQKEIMDRDLSNFVTFLGFVTDEEYLLLLNEADICISLQNPHGRYGDLKTPSKFYEFFSSGKCVITSNVGDYSLLPLDSFIMCEPYTEDKLSKELKILCTNPDVVYKVKKSAFSFASQNFDFSNVGSSIIKILQL